MRWLRNLFATTPRLRPRRFTKEPSSPCINVCRLADGGGYCIGCRRTPEEISKWPTMSDAHRRGVMQQLPLRNLQHQHRP